MIQGAMTPPRVQPARSIDRSIDVFEDRPGVDETCGEALLDALFEELFESMSSSVIP